MHCGVRDRRMLSRSFSSGPQARHMPEHVTGLPAFVAILTTLLVVGAVPAVLVSAAGSVAQWIADSRRRRALSLMPVVTAVAATSAASGIHWLLGGTAGNFMWPQQGGPVAAAVAAYCVVQSGSAELESALAARRPPSLSWLLRAGRTGADYLIAALVAVVIVEAIDHRAWSVLAAVAVPMYFLVPRVPTPRRPPHARTAMSRSRQLRGSRRLHSR